ncbi:potassium/proton antiporter, partial [Candidatus Gracilibacteria bacterium]|nr:potassium/proton antiporter [Candidatus Gracilibacteria bacterium]
MTEISIELILLITAGLLLISVVASKASSRTGVPALLLFLGIGMLAGAEGPGGIYLDNPGLVQSIGVIALVFILFSGGLDTSWRSIRPILWSGLSLANLGVLISTVVIAMAATVFLGFELLGGLLLGAIVSSTDAAAVFSVMRARSVNLRGNLEPLIEFESGSNDPIAVFLTMAISGLLLVPESSVWSLIPSFILQMVIGAGAGYALGRGMVYAVNRLRLNQEGLYPVLTIALVLLTYGLTTLMRGNGFLAVYIAGIVMNGQSFVHKRSLMRFHDGLAWLMQIAMFITLGLQVFPSQLLPVIGSGFLMALILVFVARPLSVFLSLARSKLDTRDKLMVSWVGLRGAVPIVLATFPLLDGLPKADMIFNLVFFIVLTSVLLQGTTIPWVARWLGVQSNKVVEWHYPGEFVPQVTASSQLMEIEIPERSRAHNRSIIELNLPEGALVVSILRDDESVVPSGATVLIAGDRLMLLGMPRRCARCGASCWRSRPPCKAAYSRCARVAALQGGVVQALPPAPALSSFHRWEHAGAAPCTQRFLPARGMQRCALHPL